MSQDSFDAHSHHDLLDASRLFLLDLQAVAYAAWQLISETDSPGAATQKMDAAWLQGFGNNLARLQSWIIEQGDPFSNSGVEEVQLLTRLNILHSQVAEVIIGSDGLVLSKYFERSASIIHLLEKQPGVEPGVVNIGFLLGTLRVALEDSPQNMGGTGLKSPQKVSPQALRQKINIFVAAGKAGVDAAGQLAVNLAEAGKLGSRAVNVLQSWTELPDLSTHALPGMVSTISRCQYGALVLLPEQATVDDATTDSGKPSTRHLRLPADLEFLLGLMVGILGINNTFLVVAETEKAQLSDLLIGLERATYDPGELDDATAMGIVSTKIRQTISSREKLK